jgi:uncharacterized protein (DUF433 family)
MATVDYIEMRHSAIHGKKACVAGTRISVEDMYVWYELMGKTPDQIVTEYPMLTLAQVYAALAYYFEHTDEIRQQSKRGREEAERIKAANPPKLPGKLANMDANGDSFSS